MNKGSHYTEDFFKLADNAMLLTTDQSENSGGVWLHYAAADGHGFTIEFRDCHLPALRELVEKLEAQYEPGCTRSRRSMTAEDTSRSKRSCIEKELAQAEADLAALRAENEKLRAEVQTLTHSAIQNSALRLELKSVHEDIQRAAQREEILRHDTEKLSAGIDYRDQRISDLEEAALALVAERDALRALVENWHERLTDGRRSMSEDQIEEWAEEGRAALGGKG